MTKRHVFLVGGMVLIGLGAWWWFRKRGGFRFPMQTMSNPAGVNNGAVVQPGAPDSIVPNPNASPYEVGRSGLDAAMMYGSTDTIH